MEKPIFIPARNRGKRFHINLLLIAGIESCKDPIEGEFYIAYSASNSILGEINPKYIKPYLPSLSDEAPADRTS